MRAWTIAVLMAGTLALGVRAQGPTPRQPMLQKTTVGSELYRFYCSNCHGLDAKGRPASPAMRTPSTNLTLLAMNNGGIFPREQVRELLVHGVGKGTSHGPTDMPVWGTIFRAFEPNDTMVEIRIENLIRYLESVQATTTGTGQSN
jgi:mono/diheme cytochrome c family protein